MYKSGLVQPLISFFHDGTQTGLVVDGMGLSSIMGVVPNEHKVFVLPTRGPGRSRHGLESESHAPLGSIRDLQYVVTRVRPSTDRPRQGL